MIVQKSQNNYCKIILNCWCVIIWDCIYGYLLVCAL